MPKALDLLREGRYPELWDKCCGFLDLSLDQFMVIQRRLLMEQVALMADCELGKRLMPLGVPLTVEEFQEMVPLTTYADYAPFLLEHREEILPEKPVYWQRTSGRSEQYPCKWVPVTERMRSEQADLFLALFMVAAASRRGEVVFEEHDKILFGGAPAPYTTGYWSRNLGSQGVFDFLPPLQEAEKLDFQERIARGFELALSEGLDCFFGLSSILVAVGERLGNQERGGSARKLLSQPRTLARLLRAVVKSKIARRPLLPKDLWTLKAVLTGGGDVNIYRAKVKEMWGREPLEMYGSTEAGIVALQTWDFKGLTFLPQSNFLEFIPESELAIERETPGYKPKALLLDQVKPGETYELVFTNFQGGVFTRYRIGDLVKITSLRNDNTGVSTPQMVFYTRADMVIELAGFTRVTESLIWKALEESGVGYQDWTAAKKEAGRPMVQLYIELREGSDLTEEQVRNRVHAELCRMDRDYADIQTMLGYQPLLVNLIPPGSFGKFMARQKAAGADLAHLKPAHMNPTRGTLDTILELAQVR